MAESITTFANNSNGLNIPFGMEFSDDFFFLGNSAEIRRYDFKKFQTRLEGKGMKIVDLPSTGDYNQSYTRNLVLSPKEKKIFISIGSEKNEDEEEIPRASIQSTNFDGQKQETFAFGLKNPNGLDFHPITGDFYATVNER